MNRSYYELIDDLEAEGRWHLWGLYDGAGVQLDEREFRYGNYLDPGPPLRVSMWNEDTIVDVAPPLRLCIDRGGTPLDFTFTDELMPVVTSRVADILAAVAGSEIQRFPVKVEAMEQEYEIINFVSRIRCIDEERSILDWWTEEYGRPDLLGKALTIVKLVVDPSRIGVAQMFRLEESNIAIIVSDVVKQALEDARVSGIRFREV